MCLLQFPFVINKKLFNPIKSLSQNHLIRETVYSKFNYQLALKYNFSLLALGLLLVILLITKDKIKEYQWLPKSGIIITSIGIGTIYQQAYYSILLPWIFYGLAIFTIISIIIDQLSWDPPKINKYIRSILRNISIILIFIINTFWMFAINNALNDTVNYPITKTYIQDYIIQKHPIILVNIVMIYLLYLFIRTITRRFWGSAIWVIFGYNLFYLADIIMQETRNDGIAPQQLAMIKNIGSLSKMLPKNLTIFAISFFIAITIVSIILNHVYLVKKQKLSTTIIPLTVCLFAYGTTYYWKENGTYPNKIMTEKFFDLDWSFEQAQGVVDNGPWVQFLNGISTKVMTKPTDYSKTTMKKIAHKYTKDSQQINKKRLNKFSNFTVIYNLSESFADPARVPGVSYNTSPLKNIKRIEQTNPHGLMLSSGYGGGTANMEYMALTGFNIGTFDPTLSIAYTQILNHQTYAQSVARQFKNTSAIHPYSSEFYDRKTAYPKLGIHKFYNTSSKKYPIKHIKHVGNIYYNSDYTSYDNVLDRLKETNQPQFINLVTMQNHTPYDNHFPQNQLNKYNVTNQNGTDNNLIAQYLEGLYYTDKAVKQFKTAIDQQKRPIVWVFYGDHLPGFYQNNMTTDGIKMHETDYFIYLNPAAKKLAKTNTKSNQWPIVAPENFTTQSKIITNSKVTPFEALQEQNLNKLPTKAKNTGYGYSTDDQKFHHNLQWFNNKDGHEVTMPTTKQATKIWHDYQLVQYDQTAGKHYLSNKFFTKIAQPKNAIIKASN